MTKDQSAIERISHICKRICLLWGTPELEAYINSLIMDSRDGNRSGFPLDVATELVWLLEMNKMRRAMDLSGKLRISLAAALTKLEQESVVTQPDTWGDPSAGGGINKGLRHADVPQPERRHADKPLTARPYRRREEKRAGGIVFRVITSKFVLLIIILILTIKSMWPYLQPYVKLF